MAIPKLYCLRLAAGQGRLQELALPPSVWALDRWPRTGIGDGKASSGQGARVKATDPGGLTQALYCSTAFYLLDLALGKISLPGSLLLSGGSAPSQDPRDSYSPQRQPSCLASMVSLLSWHGICVWGKGPTSPCPPPQPGIRGEAKLQPHRWPSWPAVNRSGGEQQGLREGPKERRVSASLGACQGTSEAVGMFLPAWPLSLRREPRPGALAVGRGGKVLGQGLLPAGRAGRPLKLLGEQGGEVALSLAGRQHC